MLSSPHNNNYIKILQFLKVFKKIWHFIILPFVFIYKGIRDFFKYKKWKGLFKKKNKSTEEEAIDVVEETKSDVAEDSVVKADKKEFKISPLAKIKNSLPFINKNAPIIVISMDIYEKIMKCMLGVMK